MVVEKLNSGFGRLIFCFNATAFAAAAKQTN